MALPAGNYSAAAKKCLAGMPLFGKKGISLASTRKAALFLVVKAHPTRLITSHYCIHCPWQDLILRTFKRCDDGIAWQGGRAKEEGGGGGWRDRNVMLHPRPTHSPILCSCSSNLQVIHVACSCRRHHHRHLNHQ
ncbi:hypothetical protein EGR_08511 [Echinococcus granulosus]|uniref:Uncharacterized protein n=1 Tax=Echinococcus granulosus TaxID=6210 RepID=W6U674_ECHGR|nr:hypothetical protein EGR_08511 [Echinococcus granulosus]EUB56650.1 hypothetical protein EGR_08511 [Echinococcus granulosus]